MPSKFFTGNCDIDQPEGLTRPPECPPWRQFLPRDSINTEVNDHYWEQLRLLAKQNSRALRRGKSFRIEFDDNGYSEVVEAINAAIHLRRPLLITGGPGSGKTSLVYAIAHELQLGPVLTWPITARANLMDAEYRYDAIARLQDAQLDKIRDGNDSDQSDTAASAEAGVNHRFGHSGRTVCLLSKV